MPTALEDGQWSSCPLFAPFYCFTNVAHMERILPTPTLPLFKGLHRHRYACYCPFTNSPHYQGVPTSFLQRTNLYTVSNKIISPPFSSNRVNRHLQMRSSLVLAIHLLASQSRILTYYRKRQVPTGLQSVIFVPPQIVLGRK